MPDLPVIADFSCSVCGVPVAYKELYPPGVPRAAGRGAEHPPRKRDRHWMYVSNGDRYGDRELTPEEFAHEVETLAGEHPGSYLALYCHGCRATYCFRYWKVDYSDDPPRSVGTCPRGHMRVIDY
jgi:hypothetical protein